jgi:hypothetical protein
MMQLIAGIGHVHLTDDVAVAGRLGIEIHHAERVMMTIAVCVEHSDVGEFLGRRLHGHFRGRIEGGVGPPKWHE